MKQERFPAGAHVRVHPGDRLRGGVAPVIFLLDRRLRVERSYYPFELSERAMKLNPNHPGWYRFALFNNAYRQHDYRGALDVALRLNMPSYFYTHAVLAAAYGKLGEREAAASALAELLSQKPEFATAARRELRKWYGDGELLEEVLDGLRRAGLEVAEEGANT